ncbi:MAG: hypothetical protein NTX49_09525 [Chlamydiae bacterium]|nr:hypothetical protein [Chlamydiota bacterium]
MSLPPVEYIGSTSIQRGDPDFLVTRKKAYARIIPLPQNKGNENKVQTVAERHLPKAGAIPATGPPFYLQDPYPKMASLRPPAPLERASRLEEEILSPIIKGPPMKPHLPEKATHKALPQAAARASATEAMEWSPLFLPPPAAPPEPPIHGNQRPCSPGFPAVYTGPYMRPGAPWSYPLTSEQMRDLSIPLGMAQLK